MRITKQVPINDEPYVNISTGQRYATVTYDGPRYVYVEASRSLEKINCRVYGSDTQDMSAALQFCNTGDPDLVCVELNVDDHFLQICSVTGHKMEVEDYEETLENGLVYKDQYHPGMNLSQFYKFYLMKFDPDTKNFTNVEFVSHSEDSEGKFINSINEQIQKASLAPENNSYSESDLAKINTFKNQLIEIKSWIVDDGIKFWKLPFPSCEVPY